MRKRSREQLADLFTLIGVFVALMLRFDKSKARKGHHIVKNYFLVCFLAYICGLVNTIVVMHVLRSAQVNPLSKFSTLIHPHK